MNPIDVVLILAFAVVWPAFDARVGLTALRRAVAAGIPDARVHEYWNTMLVQWTFAALALAACLTAGRTPEALRLLPPTGPGLLLSFGAIGLGAGFFAWQARTALSSPAALDALRRQIGPLAWLLPHGRRERGPFRALSITAGVCEEWFFRGYALAIFAPSLGLAGAVAASTVLFGLAHAYQGAAGTVRTGLVGLLMAGLAVATGSIWGPIVLHALVDWVQGDLVARVLEGDEGAVQAQSAMAVPAAPPAPAGPAGE